MATKTIIVLLVGLAFASVHLAEAQQPKKIPRIGYLSGTSLAVNSARVEAFRQGLREFGYIEGKNIVIECRYAEGKPDRLPDACGELVHLKVDVIVARTDHQPVLPSKQLRRSPSLCRYGVLTPLAWARCQPRAAWRKHHWLDQPCPGAKRKTTGTSEGDRSQALPRGRPSEMRPIRAAPSI